MTQWRISELAHPRDVFRDGRSVSFGTTPTSCATQKYGAFMGALPRTYGVYFGVHGVVAEPRDTETVFVCPLDSTVTSTLVPGA